MGLRKTLVQYRFWWLLGAWSLSIIGSAVLFFVGIAWYFALLAFVPALLFTLVLIGLADPDPIVEQKVLSIDGSHFNFTITKPEGQSAPGLAVAGRKTAEMKVAFGGLSSGVGNKVEVCCKELKRMDAKRFKQRMAFILKINQSYWRSLGDQDARLANWCRYAVEQSDQVVHHYLITPRIDGMNAKAYLQENPELSLQWALGVIVSLSRGLHCLHTELGICHGDIDLTNIMIRSDGRPQWIDLEMAYRIEDARNLLLARATTWSPEMIANIHDREAGTRYAIWNVASLWRKGKPKWVQGDDEGVVGEEEYGDLSAKSDVWAMWSVLWAFLGGPFQEVDIRFSITDLRVSIFPRLGSRRWVNVGRLREVLENRVPSWDGFLDKVRRPCEGLSDGFRIALCTKLRGFIETGVLAQDPNDRISMEQLIGGMECVRGFVDGSEGIALAQVEGALDSPKC